MLKRFFTHPLTRGQNIDHPKTTQLRRRIIEEKKFLKRIYVDWYTSISAVMPTGIEPVLELGAGAGFMREFIPNLITSEAFYYPEIDLVLDGQYLPIKDAGLRAIVMTNVLHHIPCARNFFLEAIRCLRPQGVIIMIEPWVSPWSKFIFKNFHHEPFDPDTLKWEFPQTDPLSGANGALPWIIFQRDRVRFEEEFPELQIKDIQLCLPFRYLASGGMTTKNIMPERTYSFWRFIDTKLDPYIKTWAMFAQIKLVKNISR
jgi:SAM-dependent methyltransferase